VIVLDASAIADWLLQTPELGPAVAERMRGERLPHTLDFAAVEVISALRRKLAHGELGAPRAERALTELAAARLRRHPVSPLAARIWQLRGQHSPYDAAYVALAEALDARLVTTDGRLARSHGHRAEIVDASRS